MAQYVKNEFIITLKDLSWQALFNLNTKVCHHLFLFKDGSDQEVNSDLHDLIRRLFSEINIGTPQGCQCRRLFIPKAYAHFNSSSNELLRKLSLEFGSFAPIYDIALAHGENSLKEATQLEDIEEVYNWLANDDEEMGPVRVQLEEGAHSLVHKNELKERASRRACTYRVSFKHDIPLQDIVRAALNLPAEELSKELNLANIARIEYNYLSRLNGYSWNEFLGEVPQHSGESGPVPGKEKTVLSIWDAFLNRVSNENVSGCTGSNIKMPDSDGPADIPAQLIGSRQDRPVQVPNNDGKQLVPALVAIIDSGINLVGTSSDDDLPSRILTSAQDKIISDKIPADIDERINGDREKLNYLDVVHYTLGTIGTGSRVVTDFYLEPAQDGTTRDNWPDDEIGHGNDIALIIANRAPKCEILPIRAFYKAKGSRGGIATVADICTAIDVAVAAGADVVNVSFTFDHNVQVLKDTMKHLSDSVCFISALGNSNNNKVSYPARYAGDEETENYVLGVGGARIIMASEDDNKVLIRGGNSNYGEAYGAYVVAPAYGIDAPAIKGEGTSYAAAFVSALAAQIIGIFKAAKVDWKPKLVFDIIRESARSDQFDNMFKKEWYGRGFINVREAKKLARKHVDEFRRNPLPVA